MTDATIRRKRLVKSLPEGRCASLKAMADHHAANVLPDHPRDTA
jgi:predicted secreted Zn-dependent protease